MLRYLLLYSQVNQLYIHMYPLFIRFPNSILEKEMATHSNILDWKIPWTEELDRLLSMGSQRAGHTRATSLLLSPMRH